MCWILTQYIVVDLGIHLCQPTGPHKFLLQLLESENHREEQKGVSGIDHVCGCS